MIYKIHIEDSNYSRWSLYDETTMEQIEQIEQVEQVEQIEQIEPNDTMNQMNKMNKMNPIDLKLFTGDTFNSNNEIIYSPVRNDNNIPGILIFIGKTYGRRKNGKLYYKCIPNDKRLPAFLVTYEQKNIGFNKNAVNRFILFKFVEWIDKHPIGAIVNMIGEITNLPSFYEYQLYCKNLFISIKEFTNQVNKALKQQVGNSFIETIMKNNITIEDRSLHDIFTIDPKTSSDLDDGIGIRENILSIYIANVPLLIEHFELWTSFSERISTIYLPDRKRPMLPNGLSDNICSLLENENRFAFCIDIEIDNSTGYICDIKFCNALIKVKKNYRYDDINALKNNDDYLRIYNIAKKLCKKDRYIKDITDSHDLIAYLMILMNCECAKKMMGFEDGIYRTLTVKETSNNTNNLSDEIFNFIKIWQSSSGRYTDYNNSGGHDLIGNGIAKYIHITSPIRRLVDLLNIMKFQELLGIIKFNQCANDFYNMWFSKLEYINTSMRAIRKIQIDCNILSICSNTPSILDQAYDGYVFDRLQHENGYLQYTIYIPKFKIVSRVNVKNILDEYTCHKFKLYLIEDGATLKRKIRAEII